MYAHIYLVRSCRSLYSYHSRGLFGHQIAWAQSVPDPFKSRLFSLHTNHFQVSRGPHTEPWKGLKEDLFADLSQSIGRSTRIVRWPSCALTLLFFTLSPHSSIWCFFLFFFVASETTAACDGGPSVAWTPMTLAQILDNCIVSLDSVSLSMPLTLIVRFGSTFLHNPKMQQS